MMQTYEFDDAVLTPRKFRRHVLRCPSVRKYRQRLIEDQNKVCPVCKGKQGPLDSFQKSPKLRVQVDHIRSVKSFADDLTIPLTEAYQQCRDVRNLQAVHAICNNARNRKNRTEGQHRAETLEAR